MSYIGKTLIGIGLFLIVIGIIFLAFEKFSIGKLPGDILIKRGNFTFYFPLTTSLILSIILTVLLSLIKR